jgi:hypothetical protein
MFNNQLCSKCRVIFLIRRYEQAKITTLIAETGMHFHVGLKYNSQTQSFEWVSGEEYTYSHWAEYEPGEQKNGSESHSFDWVSGDEFTYSHSAEYEPGEEKNGSESHSFEWVSGDEFTYSH